MKNEAGRLRERWFSLPLLVGKMPDLVAASWHEIERYYAAPGRHYHTLQHLAEMFERMDEHEATFEDAEVASFAIFYHDLVYDPLRKDNEVQSAAFATQKLALLDMATDRIARCRRHILATAAHAPCEDPDTNLLLDIDLSILGADWARYQAYAGQVRCEYALYPGFLYRRGRKKVLRHFLETEFIYCTPAFREKYESRARENLARELAGGEFHDTALAAGPAC